MKNTVKMVMVSLLASSSLLACGSKSGNAPAADSTPTATSPSAADSAHRDDVRHTKAGSVTRLITKDLPDAPGKEGMTEIVEFAPGESSQVHRHNWDLFVYVLEGTVETQLKGGSLQIVKTGGVFYESPTDIHVVSRNASKTQPATLAVFYVKKKGTAPTEILGKGSH
jgi:quercetin dioxygenase-like cupin family protein